MIFERPRKKKPRKNMLTPSIFEIKTTIYDIEEDPEDTITLSQRTREDRVVVEE